ncbi:hypothetical protein GALMADRAFT_238844 [Galerina marginata CBS 339.88]|uniref:P-loop containing nucleoside triphosphate hydrolase protein n=1 Tax=Galerina marginata (strain CBS 339.88) TaxID=685588 RepID=A0A067TT24_GALM3|nr:hypothetical protein GALMADRAFT_238844 [Galerina marginata CBS 339.88]
MDTSDSWGLQYVMTGSRLLQSARKEWDTSFLNDSFAIPFGFALFLIGIQAFHGFTTFVARLWRGSSAVESATDETEGPEDVNPATFYYLAHRSKSNSGPIIFAYAMARLIGCVVLLGLSTKTLLGCPHRRENGVAPKSTRVFADCPEVFMTLTYLYATILTIASMSFKKWTTLAIRYNILILLTALGVYIYRDIWPLATYTEHPKDTAHDELLWYKVALLAFTAGVIPLFVPRRYIPVDPKDPMAIPNDEQTCSLFAFIFYFYLDPVIFMGYRVEHLAFDQLPPLCDTDQAKNLVKRAFPHLDPYQGAKKGHIFFGMLKVFHREYTIMAVCITLQVLLGFFSPIGINRLLTYMETGGEGAYIRPWFWILFIFIGPTFGSLLFQGYIFAATRALCHTEALITQLVFEHSLRIRLIAETGKETKADTEQDNATVAGTPDTASIAGSSTEDTNTSSQSPSPTNRTPEASTDSQSTLTVSTIKGKAKDTSPPPPKTSPAKKVTPDKKDANLIGKINNLVTTDLGNITDARDFIMLILSVPLQICGCTFFLYQVLGWSAFVGLASMIVLLPVPGYAAKLLQSVQKNKMKRTDARVQDVTEAVSVLRMIKLFGWEGKMSKRIQDRRDDELAAMWKYKILDAVTGVANSIIPTVTMVATYGTYTLIMKQSLTPSIIFSSLTVFGILRIQLHRVSWQVSSSVQGKVSLDRVSDFLRNTELLDSFTEHKPEVVLEAEPTFDKKAIGFNNATFSWSLDSQDGAMTPSRRAYRLRIDDELRFKPDCINLVIGPTGSGKTSILMALLGEMHFIRSNTDSWFNLPREGGVAYAAQESWVQNATIRENIVFGSEFDEVRYRKVLYQCGLERDLELFDAGDATEVGEKGLTLSGGQKARVTLARAIYSQAEIILLDDVLAALDVHTSVWIVNKCFRGDLVKGRTVLLVTHSVALLTPVAEFIVSIGQDGTVQTQGVDPEAALAIDPALAAEAELVREETEIANQEVTSLAKKEAPADGKLVVAEEIVKGHITWKSVKLFLTALGGDYPLVFFSLWLSGFFATNGVKTFQIWFLGYWGSQYEGHDPSEVHVSLYLSLYSSIVLVALLLNLGSYFLYISGSMRASKVINAALVKSVLSGTLRWLDETPTARIIARCTQDIRVVDGPIAEEFLALTYMSIGMVTNLFVIIIFTPIFLFPGLAVAALGFYLGNIYLKAQLSVKREMSNARSPVLAHFSAAIAGLVSVRAYGAQSSFKAESFKRVDHYMRISRISYNLNRWISTRIDILGRLFTVALATYLVYGHSIGASNTGFSLNMAVDFCSMILWWVRVFNEFEVKSNSLERIQGYLDIDHEPPSTEDGKPPAAWPTSGSIVVENLSARYSQTGPTILRDLSFRIESGERVGIVGRTGSGKSTLTLALLRCVVTEGTVYYDGIPTNKINLDALRSSVTIIPQTPELISGTLRRNLDPFDQHDDATLNDALRSAGLFSVHDEEGEGRITLDSNISSGGSNLSVGEKQIIALARAMVRGSKLLILDEATSAIDYKTDSVIQTTLRSKLGSDVTVITVAHRLQTIMDADKIMVLNEGQIAEFDSPRALLQKEGSMFKALVDGSGDKADLYAMAEGKAASTSYQ